MAHRLRLGEAGKIDRRRARVLAEARFRRRGVGQIDAGHVLAADLEEQRLLDLQAAIGGEGVVGCRAVGGGRGRAAFGQHLEDLLQRRDVGRAVGVGVDLGGGDDHQVGEFRPLRFEPRDGHAGEHAAVGQFLDNVARPSAGGAR